MTRVLAAALLLAACTPARPPGANEAMAMAVIDNLTDPGFEPGWAYVIPDRRFDPDSAANRLDRPAFLADATLGYFGDGIVAHQYSVRQRATMLADHAGFAAERDLNRDGRTETYRTGYWRRGDEEGTFLAVFDRGRQRDVVDTSAIDGVFLSSVAGGLIVASCNCPQDGRITYRGGRLTVIPEGDDPRWFTRGRVARQD